MERTDRKQLFSLISISSDFGTPSGESKWKDEMLVPSTASWARQCRAGSHSLPSVVPLVSSFLVALLYELEKWLFSPIFQSVFFKPYINAFWLFDGWQCSNTIETRPRIANRGQSLIGFCHSLPIFPAGESSFLPPPPSTFPPSFSPHLYFTLSLKFRLSWCIIQAVRYLTSPTPAPPAPPPIGCCVSLLYHPSLWPHEDLRRLLITYHEHARVCLL